MKRGPLVVLAAGALVLLATIGVAGLSRSPAPTVAGSWSLTAIASAIPSASPSQAAIQPTEVAQRNAAAAVAAIAPPTPIVARISIPRIGIRNAPVYERGLDAKGLMLIAPGYSVTRYAYSAPLGTGNTFLYGHDDIQGNIFGHLYDLAPGDTVQITVGGETQVYRVTGHQIVPPTDVSVLNPTPDVRLTIMTCWPFNVDTKRWIVTAVKA
jgi:LPXTG-site transpeptidase (sortase) family protein